MTELSTTVPARDASPLTVLDSSGTVPVLAPLSKKINIDIKQDDEVDGTFRYYQQESPTKILM